MDGWRLITSWRLKQPGEHLRDNGVLFMDKEFNQDNCMPLVKMIMEFNLMPEDKAPEIIHLYINSPGGFVKSASINTGAIGCGISGSGPSVFALSKGFTTAKNVENAMKKIYDNLDLDYDVHVSRVNDKGIKIIKTL